MVFTDDVYCMDCTHVPVMLEEVLELLAPAPGKTIVDCTVGAGGHSRAVAERLAGEGTLVALDCDASACETAGKKLEAFDDVRIFRRNFAEVVELLDECGIESADGFLFDLGLSSMQLADASRGFSHSADGPLDMRMDIRLLLTADRLVNRLPQRDLADLLHAGGVRKARRVARRIVRARPVRSTVELKRIAGAADSGRGSSAAARTFQALRIAVNDEYSKLRAGLSAAASRTSACGTIVCISFHSGEDKIAKNCFRELAKSGEWELLTRKPLVPTEEEVRRNARSKSAKFRAVRRKGT